MSHKQAKRARQRLRALLAELDPIAEPARAELQDEEEFALWAKFALAVRELSPNKPLEELLPSKLEASIRSVEE